MLIRTKFEGYRKDGIRVLLIDLGGNDAPDMSGQNAAALQQAALSKEQLEWAKQIYAETAPDRANTIARANSMSDLQMEAQRKQTDLTDDYAAYNKGTFRPLEQGIVADAAAYDTPDRREKMAGEAASGVGLAFQRTQAQNERALMARGVNPNSGAALAAGNQNATNQAVAEAAAANDARLKVETIGAARKMDAANLGRNLASSQATSAGIALNQGNAAVKNASVAGDVTAQGAQIMNQGYSGAQQGLAGASNSYGQMASIEQKANDNGGMMGALGSLGGALISKIPFSDKNMKDSKKPVTSKMSLAAVRNIPVSSWKYKAGSKGDDGRQTHVGPMAQDVQAKLGDGTAPGGKKLDLISMNGHLLNAVQELDKKVTRLSDAKRKSA